MTRLAGVPGRALVLALFALALAAVVAGGLAVQGEEDLGAVRWAYIPVVLLGPVVAVAAAASGGRRRVAWLGAALCWTAVVPTMPFLLYGLTLLVAAALLTLAAAQPSGSPSQR